MKNLIWLGLVLFVFALSWFVGGLLQKQEGHYYQIMIIPPCNPIVTSCTAALADTRLNIHFTAPVVVMMPFKVSVEERSTLSNVYAIFRMKNMDMGSQRYRLEKNKAGLWQSDVVLPVCSLGRSDWTLTLEAEYQHEVWRGDLDFTAASLSN